MSAPQIVIDTNVFVAALLSQRGTSYALLMLVDSGKFEINLSVPLILEYEDAAKRILGKTRLNESDLEDILDYICAVANHREIFFLWRPFLKDPKDDMVLELAVSAACEFIVTFDKKHFEGVGEFGIRTLTPREFLKRIGELP